MCAIAKNHFVIIAGNRKKQFAWIVDMHGSNVSRMRLRFVSSIVSLPPSTKQNY